MSLLDRFKQMFGKHDVVQQVQDQVMQVADQNDDGQVNTADLGGIKEVADMNQDGSVNQADLGAAKDKLTGQL